MKCRCLYTCLFLVMVVPSVRALVYDIKIKVHPEAGKKAVTTDTVDEVTKVKMTLNDMVLKDEEISKTTEKVYSDKIVTAGVKRPLEYIRVYQKAIETTGDEKKALPYQKRTLVYELVDGKYKITAKGEPPLDNESRKKLLKSANSDLNQNWSEFLITKKQLKVGETWNADVEKLAESMAAKAVDLGKSEVTGKFVKAYKKGDQQWGQFKFHIKLAVTKLEDFTLSKPLILDMKATIDSAIDGSTTQALFSAEATFGGSTTFQVNGQNVALELNGKMKAKAEQSAETP